MQEHRGRHRVLDAIGQTEGEVMSNDDVIMVRCSRCRGYGEREMTYYVHWPHETNNGEYVQMVPCEVCGGSGKVSLLEDEIINEDPQ